jgi:hypothetical protein
MDTEIGIKIKHQHGMTQNKGFSQLLEGIMRGRDAAKR